MKLETFFENFDLLTDAPNAATKLRGLVLQLAVRGKVTDQDPDHPPASELVWEIATTQKRLIKDKKIKRIKTAEIDPDSTSFPFDVPENWQWVRLGQIVQKLGAGSTPLGGKSVYVDEGIKFLRSQNVWNDGLQLDGAALIPPEIHQKMDGTFVEPGDILLNITGASIGRCAIVPDDFDDGNVSQHVAIVRLIDKELRHYIHLCLISSLTQEYIMSVQVGISREGLSMTRLKDFLMPIPPLAEQKRIVAACDRILTLCDKIDQHQQQRHDKLMKMNEVAIAKLLTAPTPDDFDTHWQRLWQNFDLLYSIPETIPKLRQAILQLAVQGKLVEQDPDDEPVEVQIDQLKNEKNSLIKAKKIPKAKKLEPLGDEMPHGTPDSWRWLQLGELAQLVEYGTSEKSSEVRDDVPVFRMNNIQNGQINFDNLKYVPSSIKDLPRLYLRRGDILFNRTNSYELVGKTATFNGEDDSYTFASYLIRVRLFTEFTSPKFVNLAMNSTYFRQTQIEPEITQQCGQANFNGTKLCNTLVPLPPLAEQKRIVAKIDRLMALCDAMEAKLTAARAQRETLMEAAARQVLAA